MVEDHTPDSETDSRVLVNGTRVPASNVDVYLRDEGPLDISRYAEVRFASPFRGVDYLDTFEGAEPAEQSSPDVLRVDVRDYATGEYHIAFRGIVTGLGNAPSGPASIWQTRAQGPGHYLSRVPASKRFTIVDVGTVLEYVANEAREVLPFPLRLRANTATEDNVRSDAELAAASATRPLGYGGDLDPLVTPKTFQANKDWLSDVLSWLKAKKGVYVWLSMN